MINSPLRYPGGKHRVRDFLAGFCPEDFEEYREPFLGGGSVFISLKQKYQNRKFWINDIYNPLYCFWKEMAVNGDIVIEKIIQLKNKYQDGRQLFYDLKNNIDSMNEADKAVAFFILNRITFSGTTLSGGYSQKTFDGRFTDSSIDRLRTLQPLLNNTKITNYDYEGLLLSSGQNVFIYLDPPYYSATKSALYGKNGNTHKFFDHERFAKICQSSNHKWIITYDKTDYIKKLFSFANIKEFEITYGMKNVGKDTNNQKTTELLISNFDIKQNNKYDDLFNEINNAPIPHSVFVEALKVDGE